MTFAQHGSMMMTQLALVDFIARVGAVKIAHLLRNLPAGWEVDFDINAFLKAITFKLISQPGMSDIASAGERRSASPWTVPPTIHQSTAERACVSPNYPCWF